MSEIRDVNSAETSIDESPLMIFQGPGFVIQMPTNWLIVNGDDGTIAFIGPTVGNARAGFTIAVEPIESDGRESLTYTTAAADAKRRLAEERQNFTILNEQDISTDALPAYTHYFHSYNPTIDMVILQRQVFASGNNSVITLTSSVPNTSHLDEFDRLFLKMIQSFRFGYLDV